MLSKNEKAKNILIGKVCKNCIYKHPYKDYYCFFYDIRIFKNICKDFKYNDR